MFVSESTVSLTDSTLLHNVADQVGAGLYIQFSTVTMDAVRIINCTAYNSIGGARALPLCRF